MFRECPSEYSPNVLCFGSHSIILKNRSEFFRTMLEFGLAKSASEIIPFQSTSAAVFVSFLVYLYTDTLHVHPNEVLDLLSLANQYGLSGLESLCEAYLTRNVDSSNAPLLLEYADHYVLPTLKATATARIMRDGPSRQFFCSPSDK